MISILGYAQYVAKVLQEKVQPSYKLVDFKASDTVEKLSERMLKLKELEILVNKHYAPQNAKQIIIRAHIQANLEDDDSLD